MIIISPYNCQIRWELPTIQKYISIQASLFFQDRKRNTVVIAGAGRIITLIFIRKRGQQDVTDSK